MTEVSASPWDVIVIGGALAGASASCLLLRRRPGAKILILEKSEQLERRVGESTVEVSAYFLGRVLGLTDHLLEHHLPKQGMRFWAAGEATQTLGQCSEIGPAYGVRLPSYQVDRAVLDEKVLSSARAAGAVVVRPVRVRAVRLAPGSLQEVEWEEGGIAQSARGRWVVDASGVAALLARQEGWYRVNSAHPTAACWSRWTGVTSWDDPEVMAKFPEWAARCPGVRSVATNHLTGYGWWGWFIPLKGGDVSVGVVYDQRLAELPSGPNLAERLRAMLCQHPGGRELLAGARCREGDVHFRANLAYRSSTFAADGAVLVGDAAGFLDPFYSPGMEWLSYTASAAAALIGRALAGEAVAPLVHRHNRAFSQSYDRWFKAIFLDKYAYMGDHELMRAAFRLDWGMYYLGVVRKLFKRGPRELETPSFGRDRDGPPARFMALYNRRLAAIARSRRARGTWGRRNEGRYFAFSSHELDRRIFPRLAAAIVTWLRLELREGWRTWFAAAEERQPHPVAKRIGVSSAA
jgi:flavin-dependent dehydrogenase